MVESISKNFSVNVLILTWDLRQYFCLWQWSPVEVVLPKLTDNKLSVEIFLAWIRARLRGKADELYIDGW